MDKTNIIFISPRLQNFRGHLFEYIYSVSQHLDKEKYNIHVFGSSNASQEIVAKFDNFTPFFISPVIQQPANKKESIKKRIRDTCRKLLRNYRLGMLLAMINDSLQFLSEMRKFLTYTKKLFDGEQCVFFIDSIEERRLLGYSVFFFLLRKTHELISNKSLLVLRYSNIRTKKTSTLFHKMLTKFTLAGIAKCQSSSKITLLTDSAQLKEELEPLLKSRIHLIPIPAFRVDNFDIRINKSMHGSNKTIISYIGGAHFQKGCDFIFKLIGSPKIASMQIEMHVQLDEQELESLKAISLKDYIAIQENIKHNKIHLIPKNLPSEVYNQVFQNTDIMLFPYRGIHYQKCTSGIFSECLSMGKIPVVSNSTWMEKELLKLNLNDLIFQNNSFEAFEKKTIEIVDNLNFYQNSIIKASNNWRNYHNPKSLANEVMRNIETVYSDARNLTEKSLTY
ncbi:MAG: hypothetical protein COZ46_00300 [Verrucomicrobia bacterium CG_4_10_14_3_um_filter_43_23]|nr:MAG: hypothetical protein AUJ82_04640 [Verrucomicrobia bacterium CG1_02_43_26]PIP59020.1 MAG: hypothetical protein COX01_05570 [Verrucomicrobia bacterium CG22_combo_CG10-13_8_21_14_all_43_17]PIX59117.1 MAG: hypothetical protein COZ46_00300 [Verrucomicrobia bacterium CG_4_10_14_3_um_filter_43_23]PIY61361.1 MAG: hypothetical protein COY94_05810 [Verrucomicrobia bacterium CG_4_10_14_0_8_um_filter_43_34]PJA44143.1 MAG: hypothetical protein CO175_04525 [Verrucomicrobia bacterium CG_4_9_14_3_um_fi